MDRGKLLQKMVSDKGMQQEVLGLSVGADRPPLNFVSTGNLALDWCISDKFVGGGLPIGRVVEIFGPPSSGKSLIVNGIMGRIQRAGGIAILDDVEESCSTDFMRKTGCLVDPDCFVRMANKTVEQHFKAIDSQIKYLRGAGFDKPICIVLDSLAATSTRHEIEAGLDKVDMTRAAKIKSGLRQIGGELAKQKVLYIILNHVIDNIGVQYPSKLNPAKSSPGGGGPKFHASIRIELSTRKLIEDNGLVKGVLTRFTVVKNKLTAPFRACEAQIMLDKGVDPMGGMFDTLCRMGKVTQPAPGWYMYGDMDRKARREDIESLLKKEFVENTKDAIIQDWYGSGADKVLSKIASEEVVSDIGVIKEQIAAIDAVADVAAVEV